MARFTASFDVPASREDLFAYLADFSHAREWDPGVVRAERLDEGPVAPGSAFALEVRFFGREIPMRYEVTKLEAPRRVVFVGETGDVRSEDTITFRKLGGKTRITYDAVLTLKGLRRLADPLLQLAFQWIGRQALDGLKRTLDDRVARADRG